MNNEQYQGDDWLVFQYLAGELSVSEVDQFESRLAEDLPLQEAVAREVELTGAVAAAFDATAEPAVKVVGAESRSWRWVVIATAVCVTVVASIYFVARADREQAYDPRATDEFAAAWTQTMDHWPPGVVDMELNGDIEADSGAEVIASIATPDWMRIGVVGLSDKDTDGDLLKEM